MSNPDPGPTVRRRRLGFLLRDLRLAKGQTAAEVGKHFEHAGSWVSRIELGQVPVKQRDLRDLLDLYECTDEDTREEMFTLARDGKIKGWWNRDASSLSNAYQTFIGFETAATGLRVYEALVIHGLLQTEEYMHALLRRMTPPKVGEEADRHVTVRMERQKRLHTDPKLNLWVILGEGALRMLPGGVEVQVRQLQHLRDIAENLPNVTIQILPFSQGAHPGTISSFNIIDLPDPDPGLVYVESVTGGIFEEHDDAGQYRTVYNGLAADALSRADSIDMIDRIKNEIHS